MQSLFNVGVRAVVDEAPDIRSFFFESLEGKELPRFTPGSHIDVQVAPGLTRQYSLCNGPADRHHYQIAVKKEPASRGGSQLMHERVRPGDVISISPPKSNFELDGSSAPCLLVAGGIGITPLLSMARHLLVSGRQFELLYFSRSIRETAFHAALSGPEFAGRVSFHYALDPEAVRAYLRRRLWVREDDTQLYLCGPRPFMDLVEQTAAATWPPQSVHLEYFTADPEASAGARSRFVVRLARAGMACEVTETQSVVEALAAIGVTIETSCEQGVCGTCLTGILAGAPDHRDVFLTDEEKATGDKFCPCVSRATSAELVLDL